MEGEFLSPSAPCARQLSVIWALDLASAEDAGHWGWMGRTVREMQKASGSEPWDHHLA